MYLWSVVYILQHTDEDPFGQLPSSGLRLAGRADTRYSVFNKY